MIIKILYDVTKERFFLISLLVTWANANVLIGRDVTISGVTIEGDDCIAKAATERSGDRIVVRPQVNQFGRIRVRSEIFGSVNVSRYLRSSFIRAKFVQENDSIEVFPGQI